MTDYTAHVQVPDAAIGAVLHEAVLGFDEVSCATLRSGQGTWLSFGVHSDSDDHATMQVASVRYNVSKLRPLIVPTGYESESIQLFESAPMIITCGRVVIHSEGV